MQSLPKTYNTKATRGAANCPSPRLRAPGRSSRRSELPSLLQNRTKGKEGKQSTDNDDATEPELRESLTCPVSTLQLLQEHRGEATSGKRHTVHSGSYLCDGDHYVPAPRMRNRTWKGLVTPLTAVGRPESLLRQLRNQAPRSAPSSGV